VRQSAGQSTVWRSPDPPQGAFSVIVFLHLSETTLCGSVILPIEREGYSRFGVQIAKTNRKLKDVEIYLVIQAGVGYALLPDESHFGAAAPIFELSRAYV
jgi:hypothetical protein